MEKYSKYLIPDNSTLRDALLALNNLSDDVLTLFVVDKDNHLVGTLTDGDTRRGLIRGVQLDDTVNNIYNSNYRFVLDNENNVASFKKYRLLGLTLLPCIDEQKKLIRIYNLKDKKTFLPLDAVLMAGGKGERLKPLTDTIPKPLIKVGGVPIIERNIDRLIDFGITDITITLKYLGVQIQDYFKDGYSKHIKISYVEEKEPLGTIGAIKLIKQFKHNDILVMNSDLLTNIDFEQMYSLYKEYNADIIIASTSYDVTIPYAVLETDNGTIKSFKEKPTYSYHSNAGIYIMKREVIDSIPNGEFYNATDLIDDLIKSGKKVVHFQILDYWLDIGKHEDLEKAQKDIYKINF